MKQKRARSKTDSRAHRTSVAGFSTGQITKSLCNSRQWRRSMDRRFAGSRLALQPLQGALGLDFAGVDANDVAERALGIALGDDELARRIAHQLVIRKFHDRPLQEIQEPRIFDP